MGTFIVFIKWLSVKIRVRMDWIVNMLPPTAGVAQVQRDRTEMAYQQRRDVREITREIIRDARVANRQQSMSPGGRKAGPKRRHVSAMLVKFDIHMSRWHLNKNKAFIAVNSIINVNYPCIPSCYLQSGINFGRVTSPWNAITRK